MTGKAVTEYIKKFDELSQFVPHMVSIIELKIERFLKCLHPELNQGVRMVGTQGATFSVRTIIGSCGASGTKIVKALEEKCESKIIFFIQAV